MKWSYKNNIVEVACSLRKYYGLPVEHETHPLIDAWLDENQPRCVIALLIDGMGVSIAKKAGEDAFVNACRAGSVRTVYPPTTSAATTSFLTGRTPMENGWIGWCQHFEEIGDEVILFRGTSMYRNKAYPASFGWDKLPVKRLDEELQEQGIPADSLWPSWSAHRPCMDLADMCRQAVELSGSVRFLYGYYDELDSWMHEYGPDDPQCRNQVEAVSSCLKQLSSQLPEDTALLVLADHGQINVVHRSIPREMLDLLTCMPSLETRTTAFFVKPGREKEFEDMFNRIFGDSFELLSSEEVVRLGIFGAGHAHPRFKEFLGTYVAFAKSDEDLCAAEGSARLMGQHAGGSEEEAMIPLVLFPKYSERSI